MVGASHAGVIMAERLRARGFGGSITLIDRSPHLPYQRPPLSKDWLGGEVEPDTLALRSEEYYGDNGIELLLGADVTRIDRQGGGVAIRIRHSHVRQEARRFDRLVLATGARARVLDLPGVDHPDVLVLRDLDDARRLGQRIRRGPLAVIGGGFVGLEVAATARGLGTEVTVVEAAPRLSGRAVGAGTSDFLLAAHTELGVDVRLGTAPVEIVVRGGRVRGVRLADGREVPAATVLVGVGAEPRTEIAEHLGLVCDRGVVVDERCLTSDGRTIAIGDCTVQEDCSGNRVRLESVDNATEQADAAAATLLGADLPRRPTPWFWSDQGPWKLQIVGVVGADMDVVVRTDPAKPRRRVTLYFAGDALVAAECVNAPADFVAVRAALSRGLRPSREALSDSAVPLKKLLAALPVN